MFLGIDFYEGDFMERLFLFFKGILVGIGKIIPGVSGSLIAAVLGIYEQAIYSINHLKEDFKGSVSYLFPIGSGVLVAVFLFSNVLSFFLSHYYVFTMFLFLGLIVGTVPNFRKSFHYTNKIDVLVLILGFCLPMTFSCFSITQEFVPSVRLFSCLFILFLGFLDAATMVIPGVSGTALFLMLGSYSFVLHLFSNPLEHIFFTFLFGMGVILGIVLVSRLVEFCFKKNKNRFLIFIYGLLWSSIVYLFSLVIFQVTWSIFFFVFLFFFLGFILSVFFG